MPCGVQLTYFCTRCIFSSSIIDSGVEASLLRRMAHLISGGRDVTVSIRDVIK